MAIVRAFTGVDFQNLNLYWYVQNYNSAGIDDNSNRLFQGTTYPDVAWVRSGPSANLDELDMYGVDITANQSGQITGGTTNAIASVNVNSLELYWYIQGINVSSAAIYQAVLTQSNADENALIEQALGGDDSIVLSSQGDRALAFGGNDDVTGGGGDDVLDGGSGTDTAYFAASRASATIEADGNILIVTTPGEGTDRLSAFEFVNFGGQVFSVSSLVSTVVPILTFTTPVDGSSDVPVGSNIVLTFDDVIQRGAGSITIRSGSTSGAIVETFNVAVSNRITVSGTNLTIDPTADLAGSTHYFVIIDDGAVKNLVGTAYPGSDTLDFTTVQPNDPPAFGAATLDITTAEDQSKPFTSAATDPNGDAIDYLAGTAAHGTVSVGVGGSFTYTPNANYSGSDTFFIQAVDSKGSAVDQTINVTVTPVNDAPVFAAGSLAFSVKSGASKSFTASASDIDGDTLTFASNDPAHGTVTGGANGQFSYTPDAGYAGSDTITLTVSDGKGGQATKSVAVTVEAVAPIVNEWRMFAASGFSGDIGGTGLVFGTSGVQDITIVDQPGTIGFDGSFNRGGDAIHLAGTAGKWQISQSASFAVLNDGDTTVQIPLGAVGTTLYFTDGALSLRYDSTAATALVGTQSFGETPATITATPGSGPIFPGIDANAAARIFLARDGDVWAGGKLQIFGTSGAEHVTLTDGNITFDASFNRGGDTIHLPQAAQTFTAMLSGSGVLLDSAQLDALIPIGGNGMALSFNGDVRTLIYTAGELRIGSQVIGTEATALTFA